jgi:hypothetical protein
MSLFTVCELLEKTSLGGSDWGSVALVVFHELQRAIELEGGFVTLRLTCLARWVSPPSAE